MPQINRRQFVRLATAATAACTLGAGCSSDNAARPWTGPTTFNLGPASDFKDGIDPRWLKQGGFFVVREQNRLFAVSATCTHMACPLSSAKTQYVCPCHGSRFTPEGNVVNGPATTPLPRFGIALDSAGHVTVDRAKVFQAFEWNQPAAFVTV